MILDSGHTATFHNLGRILPYSGVSFAMAADHSFTIATTPAIQSLFLQKESACGDAPNIRRIKLSFRLVECLLLIVLAISCVIELLKS